MISDHSPNTLTDGRGPEVTHRALILGGGNLAAMTAKTLSELGVQVTFARFPDVQDNLCYTANYLDEAGLRLEGCPDLDTITIQTLDVMKTPVVRRDKGGFWVEFAEKDASYYDCLFLVPGLSLKQKPKELPRETELFSAQMEAPPGQRLVLLLDYSELTHPALGMSAIQAGAANVRKGGQTVVCFQHAPVLHVFGETLYDSARKTGVQFVRFGDERPTVSLSETGEGERHFRLAVKDIIDGEDELVWECDRIVAVTGPDASSIPDWAKRIAGNDFDLQDFVLSDTIRSTSGGSLASGLFVVGEATGSLDLIACTAQARAAAAQAKAWLLESRARREREDVSIGTACVRCLTCLRVCPHDAFFLSPQPSRSRIEPAPLFCLKCGICASVCPSGAISLKDGVEESISELINGIQPSEISETTFVFGCRRSAGALAESSVMPDKVSFMAVPCAGSVSEYAVWSTLAAGAKGVLVVGCHHGNCQSHKGSELAAARVERGKGLTYPNGKQQRIGYFTIAANEAARFQRLLRQFLDDDVT